MNPYTRHMTQDLTYWAPAGKDGFNQTLFEAPVVLKCRWEDKAVLFRDSQGQEVVSTSVIYPIYHLDLKGYVFRGTSTELNPIGLAGAFEIRQSGDSPNLRGTEKLNKVLV